MMIWRRGTVSVACVVGMSLAMLVGCDDAPALPPKGDDVSVAIDATETDAAGTDVATGQDVLEGDTEGPTPGCKIEPTLTSLADDYFKAGCAFSGCHSASRAGGLDLRVDGLHERLINVTAADATAKARDKKLVVAGDAENSFLYQKVAGLHARNEGDLMPAGADEPIDPGCRIFMLRKWINDGALNN